MSTRRSSFPGERSRGPSASKGRTRTDQRARPASEGLDTSVVSSRPPDSSPGVTVCSSSTRPESTSTSSTTIADSGGFPRTWMTAVTGTWSFTKARAGPSASVTAMSETGSGDPTGSTNTGIDFDCSSRSSSRCTGRCERPSLTSTMPASGLPPDARCAADSAAPMSVAHPSAVPGLRGSKGTGVPWNPIHST